VDERVLDEVHRHGITIQAGRSWELGGWRWPLGPGARSQELERGELEARY